MGQKWKKVLLLTLMQYFRLQRNMSFCRDTYSREKKHNYAHFRVGKGTDGMANVKIDITDIQELLLSKRELKKH